MKNNPSKKLLTLFKELIEQYPNQSLSQHIGIATSEYRDLSSITDKEFLLAMEQYKTTKELDIDIQYSYTLEDDDD